MEEIQKTAYGATKVVRPNNEQSTILSFGLLALGLYYCAVHTHFIQFCNGLCDFSSTFGFCLERSGFSQQMSSGILVSVVR